MVVGSICARGGSKGIPRKNLKLLAGKPLIAYTILCAQACPELDRVVVSTDDREIAAVAKEYGAQVPFLRPAELAQDRSPKWEVFRHLVNTLESIEGRGVEILVDLDTGVPLRLPRDISACVQQLLAEEAEVVVTAYEAERNPYFNMVEVDPSGWARICKPPEKPISWRHRRRPRGCASACASSRSSLPSRKNRSVVGKTLPLSIVYHRPFTLLSGTPSGNMNIGPKPK